jgi:trehalose 6-phosphate phosphatase
MIEKVVNILEEKTKWIPGAMVENNKFCLSVHFRRVDEKRWPALAEVVKSVLIDYPKLKLTQGRKVKLILISLFLLVTRLIKYLLHLYLIYFIYKIRYLKSAPQSNGTRARHSIFY